MILKVVQPNGAVEMFDGFDRISAKTLDHNEPIAVMSNCIDFTDRLLNEQESTFVKTEIWLMKGDKTINQIIAFKPVYVLSDEGKTIDKL